jgi:hypothetical protein
MIPPNILFGFELETIHKTPAALLAPLRAAGLRVEIQHHPGPVDYWSLTEDGSLPHDRSCEIVTPVRPKWAEVRKMVDVLKAQGCATDGRCGLHVHASEPNEPDVRIHLPRITVCADRFPVARRTHGNYRRSHTSTGVAQRERNHIEVRVFDARIDYWYILNRVSLVLKSLVYPKPGDPQDLFHNHWDVAVAGPKGRL